MKVSIRSQYGLQAMMYLVKSAKISPLTIIAEKENIPFDYLGKIMIKLKKAGLIKAKRGSRGGYFLAKSSKKIKIGDIIKVLEGEISLVRCLSERNYYCPRQKICKTRKIWKKLKDSLDFTLNSITLADLVKKK